MIVKHYKKIFVIFLVFCTLLPIGNAVFGKDEEEDPGWHGVCTAEQIKVLENYASSHQNDTVLTETEKNNLLNKIPLPKKIDKKEYTSKQAQRNDCYKAFAGEHSKTVRKNYEKGANNSKDDSFLRETLENLFGARIYLVDGVEINFDDLANSLDQLLTFDQFYQASINGQSVFGFFYNSLYGACKGLGSAIITLMVLWRYIKNATMIGRFSWEQNLLLFARFMIILAFVNVSFEFLSLASGKVLGLMNVGSFTNYQQVSGIGTALSVGVSRCNFWMGKMAVFCLGLVLAMAYYGTAVGVVTLVLVRMFKILAVLAVSPIPIALTIDNDRGKDVLSYYFYAFGLFLQAPIIHIGLFVYSHLLTEMMLSGDATITKLNEIGNIIPLALGISIGNALLTAYIHMTERFTDRILP